jgi:hypothetical protein
LAGLQAFDAVCSTDDKDVVSDFLCDLMHLLDRMPGTFGRFEDQLRRARNHYAAEISPQSGPLANVLATGQHYPQCNISRHGNEFECTCQDFKDEADGKSCPECEEPWEADMSGDCVSCGYSPPACTKTGQHRDTGRGVCCDCGEPVGAALRMEG